MIPQAYPLMIYTVPGNETLLVVGWSEDSNGDVLPIVVSVTQGGPAVRLPAHLSYALQSWGDSRTTVPDYPPTDFRR